MFMNPGFADQVMCFSQLCKSPNLRLREDVIFIWILDSKSKMNCRLFFSFIDFVFWCFQVFSP